MSNGAITSSGMPFSLTWQSVRAASGNVNVVMVPK
jgi:hypothetical protein